MGLCDKEHTEKFTVQLIKALCAKFNVCVVASRVDLTVFANEASYSRKWTSLVNIRCELEVRRPSLQVDEHEEEEFSKENYQAVEKRFIKVMSVSRENSARKVIKTGHFQIENSGFRLETN